MRSPLFNKAMKDMGGTLKKVIKDSQWIDVMSGFQQQSFYDQLLSFSPKTGESIDNKKIVLNMLETKLAGKNQSFVSIGEKIANKSCVVEVHIKQPGFRKKLNSENFLERSGNNGDVDADVLHVSQDIIERSELKKLKSNRINFLNWLRAVAVPGGMLTLGNGQHLVPLKSVEMIKEKIEEFKENRKELIDEFEERYPQIIETAKKKRGVFFKADEYPDFEIIRSKYSEEYRFISNNVPEELAKVSQRIYEEERAKIRAECEIEGINVRTALRSSWSGLVEHYVSQLGNDEETGKPKKFYSSGTDKLKEFITDFNTKDLTDDDELKSLLDQAKDLLDNADVDKIRTDDAFRSSLASSFNKIKEESDKLIVVKSRKFDI